jgi:histidyl-tRNA synthetase
MSIGVSRILGLVLGRGLVQASRSVPSCVLVAVADEAGRPDSERVAAQLRARGIPCEVAPAAAKFGKQIRHADRRGIPYVWFPAVAGGSDGSSVKDIRSGDQLPADPSTWEPPDADRWPTVSTVPANPVTPAEEQTS